MIVSVLVFIVYFFLVGYKNYLQKKHVPIIVKGFNLIVAYLNFHYYFNELRIMVWGFIQEGFISLYYSRGDEVFSSNAELPVKLIYFIITIYASGLFLDIGSKLRSRKLLLFTFPIISALTSFDLTFVQSIRSNSFEDFWFSFIISFITISIFYIVLLLIYYKTKVKKLYE